jgi:hypothetical protein
LGNCYEGYKTADDGANVTNGYRRIFSTPGISVYFYNIFYSDIWSLNHMPKCCHLLKPIHRRRSWVNRDRIPALKIAWSSTMIVLAGVIIGYYVVFFYIVRKKLRVCFSQQYYLSCLIVNMKLLYRWRTYPYKSKCF